MTQLQVIYLLLILLIAEFIAMRHFWLRSDEAEKEANRLRKAFKEQRDYIETLEEERMQAHEYETDPVQH